MPDRTPEERERARLEREAKRAAREGRNRPAPEPEPEPQAAPSPPEPEPEPEPEPPLESQPTGNVRRVEGAAPREELHTHDEPLPEPDPPQPPERRIPPPPSVPFDEGEKPIGVKRAGRPHVPRPHLPHRETKQPAAKPPRPPGARRPRLRIALLLVALALAAVVIWFAFSVFQPFTGDGNGAKVSVVIPKGQSLGDTADQLEKANVISSAFFFKLRARIDGDAGNIKAGRHVLQENMSYGAALEALSHNPPQPKLIRITIPEGRSRQEVAPTAREAGLPGSYLAATRSFAGFDPHHYGAPKGASLEGFLFPATYELKTSATVKALVAEQLVAFRQNIAKVNLAYARKKNLTVFDVLTIASMIEREAGTAHDRPLVAAVIYNRLHKGMPLGIDATLRYHLRDWTHPLRQSQLALDTPWNTRLHLGLPPGPIGSPGLASIQAAARPAKVNYIFYVARPCGNGASNFSSTDAQFQRDVAAYNAKRAQLGGKSPTTCKK
jgi:UPF0755 protein